VKYTQYINCQEHLEEVKTFLSQFFEEEKGRYNHSKWVTFKIPGTKVNVNLMVDEDQPITQNITFERECDSMEELKQLSKQHKQEIQSFKVTKTKKPYMFYYIEIWGPNKIVKIDMSYEEDL